MATSAHKAMWIEAHERLEQLIKRNSKRLPAWACHEFQAILNEIEEKHRGHIELRGSEVNLTTYIAVDNYKGGNENGTN
ncbi:hypothetical protein [Macrococcus capreoli]|uniref:hypothetical protein n=1 Tax=Macrococcus capreoli TaxID=2982690 RepID=UPI003EE4B7CD